MLDPAKRQTAIARTIPPIALADTLGYGHEVVRNERPSGERLRAAWCHVSLETGGGRSCWGFNLGNIKASEADGWTGDWLDLRDAISAEKLGKEWPFQRAYRNFAESSVDYWRLMFGRYESALEIADSGDLMAFAAELSRLHYFEADRVKYGEALQRWAKVYPYSGALPQLRYNPMVAYGFLALSGLALGGVMWWELRK